MPRALFSRFSAKRQHAARRGASRRSRMRCASSTRVGFVYRGTVRMFYEGTGWTNYRLFEYVL